VSQPLCGFNQTLFLIGQAFYKKGDGGSDKPGRREQE